MPIYSLNQTRGDCAVVMGSISMSSNGLRPISVAGDKIQAFNMASLSGLPREGICKKGTVTLDTQRSPPPTYGSTPHVFNCWPNSVWRAGSVLEPNICNGDDLEFINLIQVIVINYCIIQL